MSAYFFIRIKCAAEKAWNYFLRERLSTMLLCRTCVNWQRIVFNHMVRDNLLTSGERSFSEVFSRFDWGLPGINRMKWNERIEKLPCTCSDCLSFLVVLATRPCRSTGNSVRWMLRSREMYMYIHILLRFVAGNWAGRNDADRERQGQDSADEENREEIAANKV